MRDLTRTVGQASWGLRNYSRLPGGQGAQRRVPWALLPASGHWAPELQARAPRCLQGHGGRGSSVSWARKAGAGLMETCVRFSRAIGISGGAQVTELSRWGWGRGSRSRAELGCPGVRILPLPEAASSPEGSPREPSFSPSARLSSCRAESGTLF